MIRCGGIGNASSSKEFSIREKTESGEDAYVHFFATELILPNRIYFEHKNMGIVGYDRLEVVTHQHDEAYLKRLGNDEAIKKLIDMDKKGPKIITDFFGVVSEKWESFNYLYDSFRVINNLETTHHNEVNLLERELYGIWRRNEKEQHFMNVVQVIEKQSQEEQEAIVLERILKLDPASRKDIFQVLKTFN